MAGILTGRSWIDFYSKNYHLPAAFDREHAAHDISTPICINLKSVVGLMNPQPQNKVEYQLAVSLYDTGFKVFFGRQWTGPVSAGRGTGNSKLQYNQPIYFHTSISSPQVLVVVEVVAHTIAPDGRPRRVGCGWTILRPFDTDEELPDLRGPSPPTQKLEMYHGSPRALYLMDEPIESNQLLKPIMGCNLSFAIGTHKAMRKVIPLLPENIIISGDSTVPGVHVTPGEDPFRKPQLKAAASCALEGLSITLQPAIEGFEEDLCELLSEDRANRENRPQESLSINVSERRLQVGVHNGWTYIEKPQVFHVDVLPSQGSTGGDGDGNIRKTTASPSMRRSSRFHIRRSSMSSVGGSGVQGNALVLKSRVELNDLLEDPMFAVVFTLDYVISESLSDKDRKITQSLARAHTRTVTVRWAAWHPFLHPSMPEVTTALTGGVTRAPDDEFVFRLPPTNMQDQAVAKTVGGVVAFRWAMGAKDEYLTVPQALAVPSSAYLPGSMVSVRSSEGSDGVLFDASSAGLLKPPSGKSPSSGLAHYHSGGAQVPEPFSSASYTGPNHFQQVGDGLLGGVGGFSRDVSGSGSSMYSRDVGQLATPRTPMQQQQQQLMQQQMAAAGMIYGQPGGLPMGFPMGSMGQPPAFLPVSSYHADAFSQGPGSELRDLPFTQVHQPIMLRPPTAHGQGISRAAYARLYSAGFPPILDRNGEPPEVLDPALPVSVNLARENVDPLQANEVIFQFLAFSRLLPGRSTQSTPSCVFFTFQFYRFPQVTTERLLLCKPDGQLSNDQDNLPFILMKLDRDGTVLKGPPGVEVRYMLDPTYMKPGEVNLFLRHLARQTLHVDVWDGDSLLLIGSSMVDMKFLCRGGNAAVQATFELDVVNSDQTDDGSGLTGDLQRGGSVRPVSTQHKSCGKLHLRIANVGHTVENKKIAEIQPLASKTQVIVSQTAANSTYKGGQLSGPAPQGTKKVRVARAHHLMENREVATLLMTNKERKEALEETEPTRESDAERLRKLARMNAVKTLLHEDDEKTTTILGYKQEKTERMRDLKTMEIYRDQMKRDGIMTMLSQNITTEHTIFPTFATAEFFEFVLRNPYNQEHLLTIEWNDKDLRVVTDGREWRHYKQLCALSTPMEEGMFSSKSTPEAPQILLRPKETVHIPFKYQSYEADHSVMPQGPSNPFDKQRKSDKALLQQDENLQTKRVRVNFSAEDGKPMAVLNLRVEPQPHVIDQTFRFHHPENSFLRKSVRLPPFHTLPGAPVGGSTVKQVFTRCSDPNVILDCKPTQPGEPHDIFIKVAMGPSPQMKRFYVTLYIDPFLSRPIQIWQCYVHALQRVDINCIEAQTSRINLLLKGTQATRVVRCFSSHPDEMTLAPAEAFVLAAGAVHELGVAVRPLGTGSKFFFLNVVDVEYHQLVRSWLVCTSCRSPIVSRAFTLMLPVGGGKGSNKRITYTNPYPLRKSFKVLTDRPDLLQFKETVLELEGGASQAVGLRFSPVTQPGIAEVLVFINDEEDKNEETFRVTAEYKIAIE
ncbi:nephrocystin-4-like isoform X1 [Littorina saxatilis]|uniref:Nephrocystin-4 n=2 Tax=Littorina saxatilis TaxID=31220 RepID=A0AAN9G3G4_9CAEN